MCILLLTCWPVVVKAVQGPHGELLQGNHIICLRAHHLHLSWQPDQNLAQCLTQDLTPLTLQHLGRHATPAQKQHTHKRLIRHAFYSVLFHDDALLFTFKSNNTWSLPSKKQVQLTGTNLNSTVYITGELFGKVFYPLQPMTLLYK